MQLPEKYKENFDVSSEGNSIVGTVGPLFLRVRKGAEGALINIHTNEGA